MSSSLSSTNAGVGVEVASGGAITVGAGTIDIEAGGAGTIDVGAGGAGTIDIESIIQSVVMIIFSTLP